MILSRLSSNIWRTICDPPPSKWRALVSLNAVAAISYWTGALLGPVNGFAINLTLTLIVNLALLLLLSGSFLVSRACPELVGGFFSGLMPIMLGYYLQSRHWSSELFLFGLILSFAGFNLILSHNWVRSQPSPPGPKPSLIVRLGPGGSALIYTLINILIIIGLVVCLWFPAAPLPFHQVLWVSIVLAVICQELIKRRQYRQEQGPRRLETLTSLTALSIGVNFFVMTWGRV